MSTQRLAGTFDRADPAGVVLLEQDPASGTAQWSSGAVRISTPGVSATLMEHWSLIGFTLRLQAVLATNGIGWGHLGDVWAGVLLDAALKNAGAGSGGNNPGPALPGTAALPQDLSTFSKVISGSDDALPFAPLDRNGFPDLSAPERGLFGTTFIFPTPIDLRPGVQLEFTLIKTPSLTANTTFCIVSADYTLLYDDA